MPLRPLKFSSKERGAFLVISMILLIVLSAIGVASMSLTVISLRVSRNYAGYIAANVRSISMAGYGLRILQSFTPAQYPGPSSCTSTGTCNVINNSFPYNGRPILPWASGLGVTNLQGDAQTNSWWSSHAFGYEAAWGDTGNARVLVQLMGTSPDWPWQQTFKIVGYSTDSTSVVRATGQNFYTWTGFRPDPYPTTTGSNVYSNSSCSGGCPYGSCCNGSACGTSAAFCESNNAQAATFVPAGWKCQDYFETGLGYTSTACSNLTASMLTAWNIVNTSASQLRNQYAASAAFPQYVIINGVGAGGSYGTWNLLNYYSIMGLAYQTSGDILGNSNTQGCTVVYTVTGLQDVQPSYTQPTTSDYNPSGASHDTIMYGLWYDGTTMHEACGIAGDPYTGQYVPLYYVPPTCTCNQVLEFASGTNICY